MKKILSVFVLFMILAGSIYAKDKEPLSYTIDLSEIAPKITFQQNNNPNYADQAEAHIDISRQVRKLIGRLPIAGDTIIIIYEGSFKDFVYMNERNMFIGLIDDSEAAGWYKELSEYTTFSRPVAQNEEFSTSVTLSVIQKPVSKCVLNIGFHTTPELAKKRPKLIATEKTIENAVNENPVEENTVATNSTKEALVTENQSPETKAEKSPSKSWSNIMNVGLSFPQTFYTVTGLKDDNTKIPKSDIKISTFDTHYAWLPTHKSGLTFKLGMDYGMGFVHTENGDKPPFVKNDVELTAGVGYTFGKDKFRFRILCEAGFGALTYNSTKSSYMNVMGYSYTIKAESSGSVIYVPVGVDIGMHIFFGEYRAVGLYLGTTIHAMPMLDSSSSTVTKTTSGSNTSSTTDVYLYKTDSKFRCTPVIGVVLTL